MTRMRSAASSTQIAIVVAALAGRDASQKELQPTPNFVVSAKRVPDNDKAML